ncbi:flavin reductase [Alkalibaculum sp. M08DMB]|uniref:Flavin reductase n=1 Tax=Alkalibaculum sporogenes TaxID=2655001 RepID=A0A6A7K8R6_9FIRM|nr:flavin reductase [Alkalibaculum sporogenes]MPW25711.1 flavin reductase [Alkalibaculum sporogenes]
MKKWKCKVCQYIHEGELPPDICPVCGASSEAFELLTEEIQVSEDEKQATQQILFNCTYGLYIITSFSGEKINGMTSNSFVQMTDTPLQGAVGINKNHLTSEYILDSGVFAVNFLGNNNHNEVKRFGYNSGRNIDKFKGIDYTTSEKLNLPVLTNTIGYVECEVQRDKCIDLGTHTLYIVSIVGGKNINKIEPMTYAYYRATK